MRRLVGLAALMFVGVLVWQVGNRLSNDAVGMFVGLVFGVLSGVPAALLVLSAGRQRRDDDDYDQGYQDGIRETTALARGTRPDDGKFSAEWMNAMMAQRNAPAVIVVERPAAKYTVANPFAIVPAQAPVSADIDDCPDWCEPWMWEELYGKHLPQHGRRFRIVGEVE